MIAVRLPEDIEARLTELAAKTGRTKTFYVREAILNHLEDLEDYIWPNSVPLKSRPVTADPFHWKK